MTKNSGDIGGIAKRWWKENLRPATETGAVRGFRARLRRADTVVEVFAEERVIALHDALADRSPKDPRDLAALAQVLAAVEADTSQPIARAFGRGDNNPALSNIRFRRLILTDDRPELAVALRNALPLIGNACGVAALSRDFLYWTEDVRTRWCREYFAKEQWEVPASETATEETE